MLAIRVRPAGTLAAALLSVCFLQAQPAARGPIVNAGEIHDELHIAAGSEAAVKEYFPSFLDYQDLIMFHPKFGYYGSGRVSFMDDYQTFPIVLAPYFGQMIAQQIFHMWEGMRRAGTLAPQDRFTIAEFGAGDGSMAESILTYIRGQGEQSSDPGWREFAAQILYVCYDRSPALNYIQRKRNSRFGKMFDARPGDATDPVATIPAGSLKGVVLSNELPDAFSVHKVILSAGSVPEVAFVAPWILRKSWDKLKPSVPASAAALVENGSRQVHDRFLSGRGADRVYLTRAAFVGLLESLISSKNYESDVETLQFQEIYVPASLIPELAAHLRRYARLYADELAKAGRGVVTYINLGEEKFVQGSGRILKAGYVMTIDYGDNWDGILEQDVHPHLRTYGPEHRLENSDPTAFDPDGTPEERDTSDPYRGPTLNDITTDVNFSLMDAEGRLSGLKTAYFGRQAALQSGTTVSLKTPPPERLSRIDLVNEFNSWAADFASDDNFKLMIQQKDDTDSRYRYPDDTPEALGLPESQMSAAQRQKAAQIAKAFSAL